MPTFVYASKCSGCGDCVDICPSNIIHFDRKTRKAYNIEPDACWECLNCVKVCGRQAIDVRGYADFVPMGASISVARDDIKNIIEWNIIYRNGTLKRFKFPIRTTEWGSIKPPSQYAEKEMGEGEELSLEPEKLYINSVPSIKGESK